MGRSATPYGRPLKSRYDNGIAPISYARIQPLTKLSLAKNMSNVPLQAAMDARGLSAGPMMEFAPHAGSSPV